MDPVDAIICDPANIALNNRLPSRLRSIFNCPPAHYREVEFSDVADIAVKFDPTGRMIKSCLEQLSRLRAALDEDHLLMGLNELDREAAREAGRNAAEWNKVLVDYAQTLSRASRNPEEYMDKIQ